MTTLGKILKNQKENKISQFYYLIQAQLIF